MNKLQNEHGWISSSRKIKIIYVFTSTAPRQRGLVLRPARSQRARSPQERPCARQIEPVARPAGRAGGVAAARRKDKEITVQIRNAVYTTFVTALEREDIEALALVLYRIPKTVEKFGERILLAPQQVRGVDFSQQIGLLEHATECVVNLVKCLRAGINLDEVKKWNDRLQQVEGEADKAIMELYRDLFSGRHDALKVIVLKDLYELLEKIIDRCRDVGNVISQIVLKNS
jgi:uncharacterized protein Yka (UPF0111/DUF47 family)